MERPGLSGPGRAPGDISVVICAYSEDRWGPLAAAVASVRRQTLAARETIVVIDHNARLLARAGAAFPGATVLASTAPTGLSGARNCGVAAARGTIVAFLDDDAAADPDWLRHLAAGYRDPRVLGVGGRIEPDWVGAPPRWFPTEFHWVLGCDYTGLPEGAAVVRNLIGANMSFRRAVFAAVGGFRTGIGRRGAIPLGCEETELCIRITQRCPGALLRYEPDVVVRHLVTPDRARARYFVARCWSEGQSKALVTRLTGAGDGLASERRYACVVLPRGVLRGLGDALLRRDLAGLGRAGAIVAGLAVTTVGYLRGVLAARARPVPAEQREWRGAP